MVRLQHCSVAPMLNYHVHCFTIICRDKSESIVVSKVVIDFFVGTTRLSEISSMESLLKERKKIQNV